MAISLNTLWICIKRRLPYALSRATGMGVLLFFLLLLAEKTGSPKSRLPGLSLDELDERVPFLATVSLGAILLFTLIGLLVGSRFRERICPGCEQVVMEGITFDKICRKCNLPLEPLKGFYDRHPELRKSKSLISSEPVPFKTLLWAPQYHDSPYGDAVLAPIYVGAVIAVATGGTAITEPEPWLSVFAITALIWLLTPLALLLKYLSLKRRFCNAVAEELRIPYQEIHEYKKMKRILRDNYHAIPSELREKMEGALGSLELSFGFWGGMIFSLLCFWFLFLVPQ